MFHKHDRASKCAGRRLGPAWFGGSIVDAAIVLTLAGAIWLLARKKASIQLGYCLFLLVLVKLFVPLEGCRARKGRSVDAGADTARRMDHFGDVSTQLA